MTHALSSRLWPCSPLPAAGAEPMSAAEFEAYTTGRTLTYNSDGTAYGIEQYLKNRRVRWAFLGDDCVEGYWYESERHDLLCLRERSANRNAGPSRRAPPG